MAAVAFAATAALGGAACASDDDESATEATEATEAMGGSADTAPGGTFTAGAEGTVPPSGELGDMIAGSSGDRDVSATGQPQAQTPDGSAIAIEARATVAVDDVRAAVDSVTTAVTGSGGRISVADVDYDVTPARPEPEPAPEVIDGSRATLVAEVPPAELAAVLDALERIGEVSSYEQLAEDVSEQLTDLDTRIANERASIERVRGLIDSAADLEDLVFLESELRTRETTLETLLATERGLEERVAMSTLTIEISPVLATPMAVDGSVDTPRPGIVDALADGWNVFVGAAFAILLVLAVTLPFLVVAIAALVAALVVHRAVRRRPTTSAPLPAPASAQEAPVAVGVSADE